MSNVKKMEPFNMMGFFECVVSLPPTWNPQAIVSDDASAPASSGWIVVCGTSFGEIKAFTAQELAWKCTLPKRACLTAIDARWMKNGSLAVVSGSQSGDITLLIDRVIVATYSLGARIRFVSVDVLGEGLASDHGGSLCGFDEFGMTFKTRAIDERFQTVPEEAIVNCTGTGFTATSAYILDMDNNLSCYTLMSHGHNILYVTSGGVVIDTIQHLSPIFTISSLLPLGEDERELKESFVLVGSADGRVYKLERSVEEASKKCRVFLKEYVQVNFVIRKIKIHSFIPPQPDPNNDAAAPVSGFLWSIYGEARHSVEIFFNSSLIHSIPLSNRLQDYTLTMHNFFKDENKKNNNKNNKRGVDDDALDTTTSTPSGSLSSDNPSDAPWWWRCRPHGFVRLHLAAAAAVPTSFAPVPVSVDTSLTVSYLGLVDPVAHSPSLPTPPTQQAMTP